MSRQHKPTSYRVNVDSMLRLRELGHEFDEDIWLDLPDVPGLDEAVVFINKLCTQKLFKQQKQEKNMFLMLQADKLEKLVDEKGVFGDRKALQILLKDTANYHKGKK